MMALGHRMAPDSYKNYNWLNFTTANCQRRHGLKSRQAESCSFPTDTKKPRRMKFWQTAANFQQKRLRVFKIPILPVINYPKMEFQPQTLHL